MGVQEEPCEEVEPRPRLTAEQRRWLGRRLLMEHPHDRHAVRRYAETYGLSTSWLRTLRRRAQRNEVARPPGRPRLPDEVRARVQGLVLEQFEIQGVVGWRDVLEGIRRAEAGTSRRTSVMLVQQETAAIKLSKRTKTDRVLEADREGHEVLARDAMWCEDTTHFGRLGDGDEVSGEVITDRGPLSTVSLSAGPPPTAGDVLNDLAGAADVRGGWPLVLQHDRAGIYRADAVVERLEEERVVALISRVHTPTDNPVAEHVNREVKDESGLGKGVVLVSDAEAVARLEPARRRLQARLRASRGFKTADELDREMPRADTLVNRDLFYEEACSAMKRAVLGLTNPREIQKAEQDAVWRTLEKHGLARLHIGPRRTPCPHLPPVATGTAG